jgi:YebC/PmpR family DNA-binding regulatory protein
MAGHSHWNNIQHKKGAADAKRARLWSKLSAAIIVAARCGGGDPITNLKLRYAIDKARSVSMPKDNIERAIKRGTGETDGAAYEEVTYEGIGPGGVALLVESLTDNRARTNGEVRHRFERAGGTVGKPGCVAYLFDRKGFFTVSASGVEEDALLTVALEGGADDMKQVGDAFEITCDPTAFMATQEALRGAGYNLTTAEITHLGKTQVECDLETTQKILRLIDALDEYEDVQNVYSNLNLSDEIMAALARG